MLVITSIESIPKKTINWFATFFLLLFVSALAIGSYIYIDKNFDAANNKKYKTLAVAKDFTLKELVISEQGKLKQGENYSLSNDQTPFLLVHFWASWCIPCTVELPLYKQIAQKFDQRIFKIVGIVSYDSLLDVIKSNLLKTLSYTQLFDVEGVVAFQFKIKNLPASFLLNPQRQIVFSLDEPLNEVSTKNFFQKIEAITKGYQSESRKTQR